MTAKAAQLRRALFALVLSKTRCRSAFPPPGNRLTVIYGSNCDLNHNEIGPFSLISRTSRQVEKGIWNPSADREPCPPAAAVDFEEVDATRIVNGSAGQTRTTTVNYLIGFLSRQSAIEVNQRR